MLSPSQTAPPGSCWLRLNYSSAFTFAGPTASQLRRLQWSNVSLANEWWHKEWEMFCCGSVFWVRENLVDPANWQRVCSCSKGAGIALFGVGYSRKKSSWAPKHSQHSVIKFCGWHSDKLVLAWSSKLENMLGNSREHMCAPQPRSSTRRLSWRLLCLERVIVWIKDINIGKSTIWFGVASMPTRSSLG